MNDDIDWHDLLERLSEPFADSEIKYRAGATNRDKTKAIALAYADPRAYEDRLNALVPGHWQVEFTPWGENRIICHLTILGITRSSTGESGDSNPDIAGTSAEAQAFKRACTKFGLGRYLYSLPTQWVDYDANTKQLKGSPTLAAPQRAPESREQVRDAIGPKRAALMQKELAKLGVARRNQLAYATSVLGREVPDLAALEEREARVVWSAARELQDPRAA
ncbi:MAG TPA: hypothetical protein VFN07_12130 [Trueperaceae bacterium]|nr:hypothetical protein [Trueperaceae bacterium]